MTHDVTSVATHDIVNDFSPLERSALASTLLATLEALPVFSSALDAGLRVRIAEAARELTEITS